MAMRINYQFTAQTPLFTGSDEKNGTVRILRREKRRLKTPISIISNFKNDQERTIALMDIIYHVYSDIDKKLKAGNYGFYDAYSNKVKAATHVKTKHQFLTRLIQSCGIECLSEKSAKSVLSGLNLFNDDELIETIRNEHAYLMILLREYVSFYNSKIDKSKENLYKHIFENIDPITDLKTEKYVEWIPYFGGNSIRGYLRRIAMYDFCKIVEIDTLNKDTYHQLFTGGNITDSTGFEDISKRELLIENCPLIGLLGSAIGNMTIAGELLVQGARLKCKENGSGDISFWELIELNFGTRLDSSKTETDIAIIDNMSEKSQMIYQYENFIIGCEFDSSFIIKTDDELLISAFWHVMKLWKENPIIGGNSATDSGIIELNVTTPDNADNLYIDYLIENKEKINQYFSTNE